MKDTTNEAVLADMLAVYADLGYLTGSAYNYYGEYSRNTVERRFGSWSKACALAKITITTRFKVVVATTTTRCLTCDELFARPTDDPSCRRCKVCKRNQHWQDSAIAEDFQYVC